MYVLKKGQEHFEIVDGPLAGRQFISGQQYPAADIEAMATADKDRFVRVKSGKPAGETAGKTGKGGK